MIDSHRTAALLLTEMLARWNIQAAAAGSSSEALATLRQAGEAGHPYRLILLNSALPGRDSFHLAAQIQLEFPRTEILLLTQPGQRRDAIRCAEVGVRAVCRPVREADLRGAVEKAAGLGRDSLHAVAQRAAPGENTLPLRILVAEDNLINQRLAVRLIEKQGDRVEVANNGREVLEVLGRTNFDLILMDVQMPEMDGLETTVAIREKEKAGEVIFPSSP